MPRHEEDSREKSGSSYNPIVPAVDQAMSVLSFMSRSESRQLKLSEICREVSIHRSKGFTILNTLEKHGLVNKDPVAKTYSLGLGLLYLAKKVMDHLDPSDLVADHLEKLARQSGQSAHFAMRHGDHVYIAASRRSGRYLGLALSTGARFDLSHGAHGKALAAFMSPSERRKLFQRGGLEFYGPERQVDESILNSEMEEARIQGFATDLGITNPGLMVIAAPILDHEGSPVAALILAGNWPPESTMELGSLAASEAAMISSQAGAALRTMVSRQG